MIDFSYCVEAHVVGINMGDESGTMSISFKSSAKRFTLVIEGVDRLLANEFREQNIVAEIKLWDFSNEPPDSRESLSALISGEKKFPPSAVWVPLIEKEIEFVKHGEKVFISIEAIYGASFAILAKRVTFSESAVGW